MKLIVVESDCCDCDLPCIQEGCRFYKVARFYCDDCGEEDTLYYFDDKQLCSYCVLKQLEEVSIA